MRAILTAEGISALGSQMSFVALPWFVLSTTGSAARMGFVLAAQVLAAPLLGIPSAVLVQRLGVRRALLISDAARAPLLAAVPTLCILGLLNFGTLLAIVFAIGVFTAPYLSAQRLLLPETFADAEQLVVKGNALLEGVVRAAMLLGAAVAGVAIMAIDAHNVLFIDAVSYLAAFLILRRGLPQASRIDLPVPAAAVVGPGPATADATLPRSTVDSSGMLAGARYALAHPVLRRVTLASLTFGFFFPPLLASLPVLTADRYGNKPEIAGLLYAAMGLGALAGTLVVIPLAKVPALRLGAVGAAGLAVPLWWLVADLQAWEFGVVMLVCGLFTPILNAPVITRIMLGAPEEVRTKVLTFVLTTNLFAGPVAYALTGPALQYWGLTRVYLLIALGVTGAAAVMVSLVSRRPEPVE